MPGVASTLPTNHDGEGAAAACAIRGPAIFPAGLRFAAESETAPDITNLERSLPPRDRLSFRRFAGFSLSDGTPDHSTLWRFREELKQDGLIERVFEEIEEMGWTRETAYNEEFVAEKHRQLREAGWTVITTGTPGSAELLRELDTVDAEKDEADSH